MAKLLFSVVLVALVAYTSALPRPSKVVAIRIVGGRDALLGEYPHQISLLSGGVSGSHICGGSIIDETTIITAAHCAEAASRFAVRVGHNTLTNPETGSQTVAVSSVVVHELFDDWYLNNDISIMKLATPLTLSASVRTAAVPLPNTQNEESSGDLTVTGWGTTSEGSGSLPSALKTVTVPFVSDKDCRGAYSEDEVADSMICAGLDAGGKDSCQGDSGGPLINSEGVLVGVVSWGYGCARPGYPGVYTQVSYFLDWIEKNRN